MQHGLISNLHITNATQHFAHTIDIVKHGSLGLKKNLQIGYNQSDKLHCFLPLYFFPAPFNWAK